MTRTPHASEAGVLPRYLTVREVATVLRLSLSATYTLVQMKRLSFNRLGGVLRIAENDLAGYLARTRVESRFDQETV